jgi:hypothetical protein
VRRTLTIVVGALVVLAGIGGLLLFAQSRDSGSVGGGDSSGPGQVQPDEGARHGASAPEVSAAELPTSGEHAAAALARDATDLTGDEWLHALELGNVIVAYGSDEPGATLLALQEDLGPYDPELAAAGQSVILAHVDGLAQPTAVAWRHTLEFQDPAAPEVREFVEAWLGTGAPG